MKIETGLEKKGRKFSKKKESLRQDQVGVFHEDLGDSLPHFGVWQTKTQPPLFEFLICVAGVALQDPCEQGVP